MAMGSHQSACMQSEDWLTPPEFLDALGPFDLDPCASVGQPWRTAAVQYSRPQDGLALPWEGRVWLNPPYSRKAVDWLRRLVQHGTGTALVFARTETSWFFETVWRAATAVLFLEGRVHFHHPVTGERAAANAGAPSVLAAYGSLDAFVLETSFLDGQFVKLR